MFSSFTSLRIVSVTTSYVTMLYVVFITGYQNFAFYCMFGVLQDVGKHSVVLKLPP